MAGAMKYLQHPIVISFVAIALCPGFAVSGKAQSQPHYYPGGSVSGSREIARSDSEQPVVEFETRQGESYRLLPDAAASRR